MQRSITRPFSAIQKRKGEKLLKAGDIWGALESYDKAGDKSGLERVVTECIRAGKLLEAEEASTKAGRPLTRDQYIQLGDAAVERGAVETAQTAYERANHTEGLTRLAQALLESGQFQSAEAVFERAGKKLDPELLVAFGRKCLQTPKPRLEIAAEAFERAGYSDGLLEVSDHYQRVGEPEKAMEALELAVKFGATEEAAQPRWERLTSAMPAQAQQDASPALAPDEQRCSSCSHVIKKQALKCHHCGQLFDPALIEQKIEQETRQQIQNYVRGWGGSLIALGVLHFLLAGFLSPVWGVVLIALGIVNLILPHRPMLIINGLAIVVVGLMNMSGGPGWSVFGLLQLFWGGKEIVKFFSGNLQS